MFGTKPIRSAIGWISAATSVGSWSGGGVGSQAARGFSLDDMGTTLLQVEARHQAAGAAEWQQGPTEPHPAHSSRPCRAKSRADAAAGTLTFGPSSLRTWSVSRT